MNAFLFTRDSGRFTDLRALRTVERAIGNGDENESSVMFMSEIRV